MKNFFIRRPIFAISLSVVIVLLGVISIGSLSIEQYPDITPPVVEVTATYEGADASARKNGGRVLTDQEAATYTLANIFADVDNLEEFTTKYSVEL